VEWRGSDRVLMRYWEESSVAESNGQLKYNR
jgi:hypothetical protein